jgi:hypothetical protein
VTDSFTVDDLLASAQHRTVKVSVCARGDLVDEHAVLVAQLETATQGALAPGSDAAEIAERIVQVEDAMEASTIEFTVSSVPRRVWADLLAAHPPRKQDAGRDHNPLTFPPAAVAACVVEPGLTEGQATQLDETLPTGEWSKLWVAALTLNVTENPHPKLIAASEIARAKPAS